MKAELTNEQIARVFAMYLGCEFKYEENEETSILESVDTSGLIGDENRDDSGEGWYGLDDCKLLLTPLSGISDEDAIAIANVRGKRGGSWACNMAKDEDERQYNIQRGKKRLQGLWEYETSFDASYYIIQYLIQKGYAVPLFIEVGHPDNGKDAIQLGIAIDKTQTN